LIALILSFADATADTSKGAIEPVVS